MIRIIIGNQKSRVIAELKTILAIRNKFKIKNRNAWYSPLYHKYTKSGERVWDGYVKYITEGGSFDTGLLDQLCKHLDDLGKEYKIEDTRETFKFKELPTELGGLEFRDYQLSAITTLLNNTLKGIKWQRGILNEATNAGKSLIAAGLFASFAGKRKGLFLVNNKELFDQSVPDLQALLGKDQVGMISSKRTDIKRVNVCMVQTLGTRIKKNAKLRNLLATIDIVLVDEADELIGRKDCQAILAGAYNATIRVALTGTGLIHKDPLRNQNQLAYFGPIVHKTTNKELVEKGVSTKPIIKIYMGNKEIQDRSYKDEYHDGIMTNHRRHKRIWKIITKQVSKEQLPALILFKEHKHGNRLLKSLPEELKYLKVEMVHHKTANRTDIFKRFNEAKIDILISSMIIKRGKNLPLIKTLINAAGGTSEANVLQIFGRALRSHKSKKKVYMIDLYDIGFHLSKHSKRRIRYYAKQKFPVKELYKKALKKITI